MHNPIPNSVCYAVQFRTWNDEYFDRVRSLKSELLDPSTEDVVSVSNVANIVEYLQSPSGYFSNLFLSQTELDVNKSTMIVDMMFYNWNLYR